MRSSKRGMFYVSDEMFEDDGFHKALAKMGFIPLRVEHLYPNRFEYAGISFLFDDVEIGKLIPEYHVKITKTKDGEISVSVEKV